MDWGVDPSGWPGGARWPTVYRSLDVVSTRSAFLIMARRYTDSQVRRLRQAGGTASPWPPRGLRERVEAGMLERETTASRGSEPVSGTSGTRRAPTCYRCCALDPVGQPVVDGGRRTIRSSGTAKTEPPIEGRARWQPESGRPRRARSRRRAASLAASATAAGHVPSQGHLHRRCGCRVEGARGPRTRAPRESRRAS